jgi:hypothetical protein
MGASQENATRSDSPRSPGRRRSRRGRRAERLARRAAFANPVPVEAPSGSANLEAPPRLRQFVAWAEKVFGVRTLLGAFRDARRQPDVPSALVALGVFFCGLLRIRSFNALEPKLAEKPFKRLVGLAPKAAQTLAKLCAIDTVSRALCVADLESARDVSWKVLAKAERNKVFREGWIGGLRILAIDGWEPFCSRTRHCAHCLVRRVKVKREDGALEEVDEYFHRYVVAMLIDDRLDLVLDFESLLPGDLRPDRSRRDKHEGEQTAALRLLKRIKKQFPWLDAVAADGLYPNGPFLTAVKELKMSAIVVAQKDGDEPLKEAISLWGNQAATQVVVDKRRAEHIELWDCPDLETLGTYGGKIRVVRARISDLDKPDATPRNWCVVVTGRAAKLLSPRQVIAIARGRWHIENTGFHQWTKHWKLKHVFVHDDTAIQAIFWLFFAAYDLLTLFLYRQLRSYGRDRGKDPTKTISRLIDEMTDDLARLLVSPWLTSPLDTT